MTASLKISLRPLLLALLIPLLTGCAAMGYGQDDPPEAVDLPSNPIARAAVQGLKTSYKDSTMWEIQNVETLNIVPTAPNRMVLQEQDPKELYCVCLEYEARYKVPWTTTEGSPWERTVRNILVMKTQGDQMMALRPLNICSPFCE